VPPADPLAQPAQQTTIWQVYADGRPAALLGGLDALPLFAGPPAISPDLGSVAYLREGEPGGERTLIMAHIEETGLGEAVAVASGVETIESWSKDGVYVAYGPVSSDGVVTRFLAAANGEVTQVGEAGTTVFDVRWLDGERFFFLQSDPRGFVVGRGDVGGLAEGVAGAGTLFPTYDFAEVAD
jgi:hypothetical protein